MDDNQLAKRNKQLQLWAELMFVFMPLVIIVVAFAYKGQLVTSAFSPEWAFGASILFGQTLVKFILMTVGIASSGREISLGALALLISAFIVLLVVPSLLVLVLVLITDTPSILLAIAQIGLFILSVLAYLVLGGVSVRAQTKGDMP